MLHVSLLGEQAITDDETGVGTRSPRSVALVAFLAVCAGLPQVRQRIAGRFWPESTDAQALTNLRRELHHLRQVLGAEPSLVVTSRDLCWRDTETCRVDVRVFDTERRAAVAAAAADDSAGVLAHGARAIAQYKGDLLPGMYDGWLLDARSELEDQCVEMCDLVGAARARTGDLAGAVEVARRRIQFRPLEEVGYRALMQLQADLGDRAGAVSTYHHCASVLERELGVTPDRATGQAFRRLMAGGDPTDIRPAVAGRSGFVASRLVGRSRELDLLQSLWRNTSAGRPGLALVRGGAGVGKTRLVSEIAELARLQGAVVASSQCFGSSGRLALAPVADWVRNPAVQSAIVTLDDAWRAEVDRLVPATSGSPDADISQGPGAVHGKRRGGGSRAMVDAWQRHRFFEGLARALLGVNRPTLLVCDNMQWCDQETLAFLTFCLRLNPGAQLMVAGTLRDDHLDEDHELMGWIVQMRAAALLTEIAVSPLDVAYTASLAETISGRALAETEATLLQATTGGFPLYVIEAVRGSADPGSAPDLSSVLRNRLEQASAPAREVAGLAAAVGTDFSLELLTEASDLEPGVVVEAVDELWRRRIMHELRDGYDFSHDLLREAAYAQVSPPKRWLLHRRIAQGLELVHAADTDAVSAQLAQQYARGGRPERAVHYYQRAADLAAGLFAHAEAIRLHTESLSIVRGQPAGRSRDAQELSVLEAMAAPLNARFGYSSPELQQVLERSVTLAESLGRNESMLTDLVGLFASRIVQGRTTDAYETAARALTLVDPDSELSGPAHFAAGGSAVILGKPIEALRSFELAARVGSDGFMLTVGTRPDVHGTAWAAHAHWLVGNDDAALASCAAAIKLGRESEHPYILTVALAYGGITHQMRGDTASLRAIVEELRELCERHGFAYYREWALILDGWSSQDEGGIELARRGISNLKAEGSLARMPYWLSLLADLWVRNNRPDTARAILDAALVTGRAHDDVWWLPEVMRMRAAHDDDEKSALARLRAAAELAAAHGSVALVRRCERDVRLLG